MPINQDLIRYYKERANEYEKIYFRSEEQDDLKTASKIVQDMFPGKSVLEIACGTGYWTQKMAETADYVYATDINESMLEVARQKSYKNKVDFAVADFYRLEPGRKFDALFGGFIWSHILLDDINPFLQKMSRLVAPCGRLA